MCRTGIFLERWVPWPALRTRLLGRHLERCPSCLKEAEDWPPALRQLIPGQKSEAASEPSLWPEVRRRINAWESPNQGRTGGEIRRTRRQLAWTGAAALALVSAAWVALRTAQTGQERAGPTSVRAGIRYAKLRGERARAHIFQTSRLTFIMITKPEKAERKNDDES